jgi:hemolysin III
VTTTDNRPADIKSRDVRPTDEGSRNYGHAEELFNIYSHAVGAFFSIIALLFLVLRAAREPGVLPVISFTVFGCSLVLLYVTSTLYHRNRNPVQRQRLRIFDHVAIFVLIAGTYTPFALITLQGWIGWVILATSWGLALTGAVLKLFFTGRFHLLSTAMYVLTGWLVISVFIPLTESLPAAGFYWLLGGGISYSTGAVLYNIRRIPFNHAIFHCFVLAGSACHFVSVYYYVLSEPL